MRAANSLEKPKHIYPARISHAILMAQGERVEYTVQYSLLNIHFSSVATLR